MLGNGITQGVRYYLPIELNLPVEMLNGLSDLKQIDVGSYHTILLSHGGIVFGAGLNSDCVRKMRLPIGTQCVVLFKANFVYKLIIINIAASLSC